MWVFPDPLVHTHTYIISGIYYIYVSHNTSYLYIYIYTFLPHIVLVVPKLSDKLDSSCVLQLTF